MSLFREKLEKGAMLFGCGLSSRQINSMEAHWQMVAKANINLTAIADEEIAVEKHYLDSLLLLPFIEEWDKCVDIGSGAGFPGIPIAIVRPESTWLLLESMQKRAAFLTQVKNELHLNNVSVLNSRAETAGRDPQRREKYQVVTARAVTTLAVLAEYALPLLDMGGRFIAMKGPAVEEELGQAQKAMEILGGEVEKLVRAPLPFSGEERSFVVIRKRLPTPDKYPRREGMPEKRPLAKINVSRETAKLM